MSNVSLVLIVSKPLPNTSSQRQWMTPTCLSNVTLYFTHEINVHCVNVWVQIHLQRTLSGVTCLWSLPLGRAARGGGQSNASRVRATDGSLDSDQAWSPDSYGHAPYPERAKREKNVCLKNVYSQTCQDYYVLYVIILRCVIMCFVRVFIVCTLFIREYSCSFLVYLLRVNACNYVKGLPQKIIIDE